MTDEGAANIADAIREVASAVAELAENAEGIKNAIQSLSGAVTASAAGGHDAEGGYVTSLTESVMGVTKALSRIANAKWHEQEEE